MLMAIAGSPTHIVLAEDNPADVRLVREALAEHQIACDLRVIGDGGEAIRFIVGLDYDTKTPCPDLLLLDLHLPKHNGEEILTQLRASERCGRTPVVILTSSKSLWDERQAEKNTAVHYFRKPSNLSQFMQLGSIVKEVISRAGSH